MENSQLWLDEPCEHERPTANMMLLVGKPNKKVWAGLRELLLDGIDFVVVDLRNSGADLLRVIQEAT